MFRRTILLLLFSLSTGIAGLKVPATDLVFRDRLWFYGQSDVPFAGVAFAISKETGNIIQQTNYIDGLAWGKYYEWWPDGAKKVDGTYRYGLMFGRWKFFFENGKILCAGSYMSGKGHRPTKGIDEIPQDGISGLWTYWDKEGRKVEEGYYTNNGIEKGNWAFWDIDGKKRLGIKIDHETFKNAIALKHLNGVFLVSGPVDGTNIVYIQAHGAIRSGRLDGPWIFWDREGLLSSKKYYDKGIPSGQYTTYHPAGYKLTDGTVAGIDDYGNLIKDGKWIFWDENGTIKEEVHFNKGKREGLTTYFSKSGNESAKIVYKDDQPWYGEWTTWYPDGAKKESGTYEDGQKKSPWMAWFDNGQKKYVLNYRNNVRHGLYTEWNRDGRLTKDIEYDNGKAISEYLVEYSGDGYTEINRRNGELSGSWIQWYANGKKSEEGVNKYGKKGGLWTGWYENGEKQYQAKYIDGKPDGLYTELDNKGRITKKIEYDQGEILSEYHIIRDETSMTEYHKKNGVLEGLWTRWYGNGQKAEEGLYKNGKRSGNWNAWYKNVKKKYTSQYLAGKRSGTYREWNSRGKKIKEIDYSDGTRIREYIVVKDGNGFMEINKVYGTLDGSWIKWYAEGKKEEDGEYKGGMKIGTWSRYNMTGVVVEEWNYDNKGRNLCEITYYNNGTVKRYCDYFSKTIQEYNMDGSMKGEKVPF